MTRVSLKEAYDNKDVVAQIYAIRDIAEGAEDTADSAVTTANTASDHVDALVPQVEGAVQNANNASASAQASAQTVAGYENRLSAVEGETAGLDSDLNAVTLRVTTAEGQIVTIQGRVTALETADGQNVKLTGTQTIGGVKHFAESPTAPTTTTGLWDAQVANGLKIKNELDNYSPMVRSTGNIEIAGIKTILGTLLDRWGYCKNTTGATGPIPLFKLPTATKNDGYLKTVLLMAGRTAPTSITEVIWNNDTLIKTDIVGTQTNQFMIMSDTAGDYWLCIQVNSNNSVTAFQMCAFRNAGFDTRMFPIATGETPNMSGWSLVVSQS